MFQIYINIGPEALF